MPMSETIIYTHFGVSDYLSRTLECASITNPSARRILIGDDQNKNIAHAAGWEAIAAADVRSDMRREFSEAFRRVQGRNHNPIKNGRDWLRYVFERWFIVEAYCAGSRIPYFWHFDSDVMVLTPLAPFSKILREDGVMCTRQCNDTCLNGYVQTAILTDFCQFMLASFRNDAFLNDQQREFDEIHPDYAFTEMRAFHKYCEVGGLRGKGVHLESHFDGWWFDDCISQDDGFEMVRIRAADANRIKDIRFVGDGFYGCRAGKAYRFAALNCSWVPIGVFDWILTRVRAIQQGQKGLNETISGPWLGPRGLPRVGADLRRHAIAMLGAIGFDPGRSRLWAAFRKFRRDRQR
jgi:hypothetical protein